MIITLTVNPAIDHSVTLEDLVPGDANRVQTIRSDPGGKGINVSRVLMELGCESLAMGFVSGTLGRFLEHTLREHGIYTEFLHTPGQTRTNITILDRKHNITTTLNEPGPFTSPHHVHSLLQRLKKQLKPGDWLVIGGSIPPGIDPGLYGEVITLAKNIGVKCILDADGEPFLQGLAARPYMVKPNQRELERILGRLPKSKEPLMEAAEQLHAAGIEVVVLSQGLEGAIMVNDEGVWRAYPPAVPAVSTVGAGDAMVAGMVQVLSQGGPLHEALRLATAAGAAATLTPGTQLCYQADVVRLLPRVQVHRVAHQPHQVKVPVLATAPSAPRGARHGTVG